jgi:hypothetical protein
MAARVYRFRAYIRIRLFRHYTHFKCYRIPNFVYIPFWAVLMKFLHHSLLVYRPVRLYFWFIFTGSSRSSKTSISLMLNEFNALYYSGVMMIYFDFWLLHMLLHATSFSTKLLYLLCSLKKNIKHAVLEVAYSPSKWRASLSYRYEAFSWLLAVEMIFIVFGSSSYMFIMKLKGPTAYTLYA